MEGTDLFVEIGMKEEDIATLLFEKKLADLTEDAFDGSKEERCIFEHVFCLKGIDGVKVDHYRDSTGQNVDADKSVTRSSTPSIPAPNYKTGRCRIVESFTAGNLSSYHFFCPSGGQQAHQVPPSPFFRKRAQELPPPDAGPSELAVHWTPPPTDRVYARQAVTRRSERARLCSTLDLESINVSNWGRRKGVCGHGRLTNHLRLHAHLLMAEAGWKIEGKKRGDTSKVDHVYVAPDKVTRLFSLPRAWKCFGHWLLMSSSWRDGNESNGYGRQWSNMHEFLYDLKNTLLCLQYEVQRPKQSLSFLQQWQLLDPFMAVICIDKKVAALKNGVALKAMNSTVTLLSHNERKQLSANNTSRFGINYTSNCNNMNLRPCKNLMPLLSKSDGEPDKEGSYLRTEQIFGIKNPGEHEVGRQSCMSERNDRSIRSTAHRIVMGLHDTAAFVGSRQACLGRKKTLPCIKSKVDQQAEDNSDPLYFPPNYASASVHLVEDDKLNDPSSHGPETAENPILDNAAHSPDEMLLGENILFSHEVDEMLLGITEDINNGQHDAAAVPGPQVANKDVGYGPCGAPSLPPDKDTNGGTNKDDIFNEHCNPVAACELKAANEYAVDQSSGALPLGPGKDTNLEANGMNLEDTAKTGRLSSGAAGGSLVNSEPQLLFVSPQDGTLSFINNSTCNNQELWSCLKASHDTNGTNMQLDIDNSVYEASLIQGFLYLDSAGSPICWTVMDQEPPRQSIHAADWDPNSSVSEHRAEMNIGNGASTSQHKQMLGSCSSKKAPKRPNKTADIQDNGSRKKQKVNEAPSSGCMSQHMHDKSAGLAFLNENEQTGTEIIEQSHLNLAKNKDGKEQGEQCSENSKQLVLKEPLKNDVEDQRKTGPPKTKFDDDDLLMTAVIHKLTARYRHQFNRRLTNKFGFRRSLRSRRENDGKADRMNSPRGARTVLTKLLEMGLVGRGNILQYRGSGGKNVIKDGSITKNGILCRCCGTKFTMSKFKCHAGLELDIPSLNLFLGSGKSYSLCQLQAWSLEHKVRKGRAEETISLQEDQNDDVCGSCGEGGELICCDSCPASYHQACIPCQVIPDGSWYCSSCLCNICGELINSKELTNSCPTLQCSQCNRQYHAKCTSGIALCNEKDRAGTWLCGTRCQQIYVTLASRVGVRDHTDDGFSCTILRNNGDQKVRTAAEIALMAECNMKLIISLSIMEECFLPILDPRTGIDIIPSILYNWGSEILHLDHKGFYTVVLENDDSIIAAASIRLHGATVAEMPLIATCPENRQQGMCRRLMNYIEEMLKSLKVEMLLLYAIPQLVDTWTSAFGFGELDDSDKKELSKVRLASVPGTVVLKKNLYSGTDTGELPDPKPFKVYSRMPRKRTTRRHRG